MMMIMMMRQVGTYLTQHGYLFQKEKISFNNSICDQLPLDTVSLTYFDGTEPHSSDVRAKGTHDSKISSNTDAHDEWDDTDDTSNEGADVYDTLYTLPDFLEDDERQAVYTALSNSDRDRQSLHICTS